MKKTVLAIFIHTLRKQALFSDCWQNWSVESAYRERMQEYDYLLVNKFCIRLSKALFHIA